LASFSALQNFNDLTLKLPLYSSFSPEDIYHTTFNGYTTLVTGLVDTNLYNSYNANDLRLKFYFYYDGGEGGYIGLYHRDFKRNYYDGIATNEIFLTRAECYARGGYVTAALSDLNTLLANRFVTGTYVPYSTSNADSALAIILIERRKELWLTGVRWTDLRRLNKDPRFAVTLSRILNGITYTLPPNDPRYALPIPDNEIELSGIQQNER
jgi:hypothetical protein